MRKTVLICLVLFFLLMGATVNKGKMPGAFISDEAAYFMMTQSLAEDGDLRFTVTDVTRVWQDVPNGPEGVILKSGDGGETVYYAKPFLYSLAVVPFYFLLGANGFVFFNLLLMMAMVALGARYLESTETALQESLSRALLFSITFFMLTATFPYAFWYHPEIFGMFLIFCGCYFSFPRSNSRSDVVGEVTANPKVPSGQTAANPNWRILLAVLFFGLAVCVKFIAAVFLPLALAGLLQRKTTVSRIKLLVMVVAVFLLVIIAYHGTSHLWAGGWSPYYGNRRSFNHVSSYPGLVPAEGLWDYKPTGGVQEVNTGWSQWGLLPFDFNWQKFRYNIIYYFLGRHTGIFIYFFPSLICLAGFLGERRYRDPARVWLLAAIALHILFFIFLLPFNYQGGGGFIGNRYFVVFFPAFFFLRRSAPGRGWLIAGWAVAGLFLSQLLFTPFGAVTDRPTLQAHVRNPIFRMLPYETTLRFVPGYQQYWQDKVQIKLLDTNAYHDDGTYHFWVQGEKTASVLIASPRPLERMLFRVSDPEVRIRRLWNRGTKPVVDPLLNPERNPQIRQFEPGPAWIVHPPPFFNQPFYYYGLKIHSPNGTIPYLEQDGVRDYRYLGCRIDFLGGGLPWEDMDFFRASAALHPDGLERLNTLETHQLIEVPVEVVNHSPYPWTGTGDHPVHLSYHWFHAETGERAVWEGLRRPLDEIPAGKGRALLSLTVRAPQEPGEYIFQPDLICDGISWFANRRMNWERFPEIAVTVQSAETGETPPYVEEAFYRGSVEVTDMPEKWRSGKTETVDVLLHNESPHEWSSTALPPVRISYHWIDEMGDIVVWDGVQSFLPDPLRSGELTQMKMQIICPDTPGQYTLQIDLVCDGVNWFSAVNGSPLLVFELEIN